MSKKWKHNEVPEYVPEQDPFSEDYRGMHVQKFRTEKQRAKGWTHNIFLFTPQHADDLDFYNTKLCQIVNVYEHTLEDFEFNSKKIIAHYKDSYGNMGLGMFTVGQSISFRVYKGQKEPFQLPLFRFFVNYTMLILPIVCKCDMTKWIPWEPHRWTSDGWVEQMDRYIEMARPKANMRFICECLELSKYLMNLWVARAGDRLALSISNNEFISVMQRDERARRIITCKFEYPEGISPTELEELASSKTTELMNIISEQTDLAISVYTLNGLFNKNQFQEFAAHITQKPDLNGNTIPYTYPTNIMMGITDLRAFSVDAHGGRKAEIMKLLVSDAGTLMRSLMMMTIIKHVDINYECNSRHFRKRLISRATDLKKLEGRVYTFDPDSDVFYILDPHDRSLIGKTIYMKTVITCCHPRRKEGYVCAACYGMLMARVNCDVDIGRLAAAESSDEIEQKLLSAKHALKTNTIPICFTENFNRYFELGRGSISMNRDMIEESMDPDSDFQHLSFEFYPKTMGKHQDGESRHYDRSFKEIVIYDDRDDSRIEVSDTNGTTLYLSPEFNNDQFLPAMQYRDSKNVVRIPFSDIIDTGKVVTQVLFEFSYKNNEIAHPLMEIEDIMFNNDKINEFRDYDECLNALIPRFERGGVHIPDYQTEMLIAQMITKPNGGMVNWNEPNPEYVFNSITKAIRRNPSALTSVTYRDSGLQIAGAYDTYEKSAPSDYAYFIYERGDESSSDAAK